MAAKRKNKCPADQPELSSVPETNEATVPEANVSPEPETHEDVAPEVNEDVAPAAHETAAPDANEEAAPEANMTTAPETPVVQPDSSDVAPAPVPPPRPHTIEKAYDHVLPVPVASPALTALISVHDGKTTSPAIISEELCHLFRPDLDREFTVVFPDAASLRFGTHSAQLTLALNQLKVRISTPISTSPNGLVTRPRPSLCTLHLTSHDSIILLPQRRRRPPASSYAPSVGLLPRNRRRPSPTEPPAASSRGPPAALLLRPRAYLCPRSSPAAARLPPAVAPLRDLLPRTRRCRSPTGSRASTTPKILHRWAGSGTPHPRPGEPKHAVGRVHSTRHLLPRHVAAYPVITATTHRSGRDPPRSPTSSVRAVLPICSLDSRAKSAPKSAERAPDFLCLKFSCTMETPFETLAGDVLTSCRSQSPRVAGRALYPSASSPAP
ncbi:proteoglycan 4-like [Triticum dicoccoides]|uniref:proteoglycan 4-like n=1 Tax=Triticum dicoccoides TaxID=85692 RepID=UPI0018913FFF|nr:proteoglycan 4-like [Triticum dicoccoides]